MAKLELTEKERIQLLKEPIRFEFIGNEKKFEEHVKEVLPEMFEAFELPPVRVIKQQHQIRGDGFQVIIDLLVQHTDDSMSVIEIKKGNQKNPYTDPGNQMKAIGQLLLYKSMVKMRYGHNPRLFLVDNKIHIRTMLAFSEMKLPISLVELQKNRVFAPYLCQTM